MSTPRAITTPAGETQPTDTYRQIIPGMSECLYPTLTADGSLSTHVADDCSTLHKQITTELEKYLQEAADKHQMEDNYFDGQHTSTNTSTSQQEANYLEDDDAFNTEEASSPTELESHEQDTGIHHYSPSDHQTPSQDDLAMIPEEEEQQQQKVEEQPDPADQSTLVFKSEESEEELFNTAVDTTSDDSAIMMGKPVTTAFISDQVQIPTEKVGCLQVNSQLQVFLDQYPPKLKEKAFEHIYQILQVLDKYLFDNLKQHQHCMSPDSEYVTLIMYTTKLEIDLCNFPAIWAVLSILLDTKSNDLQYVQCLQQVVDDYYDMHTKEAMMHLEQQASKILDIMYDNVTKQNFDSISDDVDRVSDAVDRDTDKADTNKIKVTYDNDSDTSKSSIKYDQNMKGAYKDTDAENNIQNDRYNDIVTKSKWSMETNEVDNQFLRDYNIMCRQMEDRQIDEYYKTQRQIYSAMMGDTPVKTVHNRQYIDSISAYDSEVQRISNSVCHKLDLGPMSLPGVQQHTTVVAAAAMKIQDNSMQVQDTVNALKALMQNDNGQYKSEIYKRAEGIIPQLDGTHNISNSSDADLPDYLDLANANIIPYKTRGQKQRQKAAEAESANRHVTNIESRKPNTRTRKLRQKVPDDEEIDMDKIVKDNMPRYAIK